MSFPGSPRNWSRSGTMSRCSPAAIPAPRQSSSRCGRGRCGSTAMCAIPDALHMTMLEQVRRRAAEFDMLHFHLDYYPFSPVLPPVDAVRDHAARPARSAGAPACVLDLLDIPVVSISDSQRRPVPHARWVAHDSSRPAGTTVDAAAGASLLISPSLAASRRKRRSTAPSGSPERCGLPLKIAAKVDRVDQRLFRGETIRPLLDPPHVEYIGEIGDHEKSAFLSGAIALLTPIAWPEPFGLVMIEAMGCGTPVIVFDRGSVPRNHRGRPDRLHCRRRSQRGCRSEANSPSLSRIGDPPPVRAAFHRAADGQRLSRGLCGADREPDQRPQAGAHPGAIGRPAARHRGDGASSADGVVIYSCGRVSGISR